MATTFTSTVTKTFTRVDLLMTQIRVALLRAARISQSSLDRIERGVRKAWISNINIYAFDDSSLCRAQLLMGIDWSIHDAKIAVGKTTVVIDERWSNDTAIEVQEAV